MGRAIVREPAVFLFDEPLSNLDAKLRVQMRAELQALHRRLGTTSLYVTHDQVETMTLAHRMIVMNAGRAEQIGTPMQVYEDPQTIFVAGFIGSPSMNFLPGKGNGDGTVALDHGGSVKPAGVRIPSGQPVTVGIRPEHVAPLPDRLPARACVRQRRRVVRRVGVEDRAAATDDETHFLHDRFSLTPRDVQMFFLDRLADDRRHRIEREHAVRTGEAHAGVDDLQRPRVDRRDHAHAVDGVRHVEHLAALQRAAVDHACTRALELSPKDEDVYNARGLAHFAAGNDTAAITDLDEAIRLAPKVGIHYKNRYIVRSHAGKLAEAKGDLAKACELGEKEACDELAKN